MIGFVKVSSASCSGDFCPSECCCPNETISGSISGNNRSVSAGMSPDDEYLTCCASCFVIGKTLVVFQMSGEEVHCRRVFFLLRNMLLFASG